MEHKEVFFYNPDNHIFEECKTINNINANGNDGNNGYDKVSNYYSIRGIWLDMIWFNVKTRVVQYKGGNNSFQYKIDHDDKKFLKRLIFNEDVQAVTIPPNISQYKGDIIGLGSDVIDEFAYMEGVLGTIQSLSKINSYNFIINTQYIYLCNHFQYVIDNHLNENFNIVNKKMPSFHINDVHIKDQDKYDDDDSDALSTFRVHVLNNSSPSELSKWNKVVNSIKFNDNEYHRRAFTEDTTEISILLLDKNANLKDYIKCNLMFKKKDLTRHVIGDIIIALENVMLMQDNYITKYIDDTNPENKGILKKLEEKRILLSNYIIYLKTNSLKYDEIYNTVVNITGGYFHLFNENGRNNHNHHKMANSLYYMLLIIIYDNINFLKIGWITYDKSEFKGVEEQYSKTLTHFGANMFNNEDLRIYFNNLKTKITSLLEEMYSEYERVFNKKITEEDLYIRYINNPSLPNYNKDESNKILKSTISLNKNATFVRAIFIKLYYDRQMIYLLCDEYESRSNTEYFLLSMAMRSLFKEGTGLRIDADNMIWLQQDFNKIKVKLEMFSKKLKHVRDKRLRDGTEIDDDSERGRSKRRKNSTFMTLYHLNMFSQFFK